MGRGLLYIAVLLGFGSRGGFGASDRDRAAPDRGGTRWAVVGCEEECLGCGVRKEVQPGNCFRRLKTSDDRPAILRL